MDYAKKARQILRECGAFVEGGHFIYSSGRHGDFYINKDALYMYPRKLDDICFMLSEVVLENLATEFDVVVSPTYAGVVLGNILAYNFSLTLGREILFSYSDKDPVGGHRVLRRGYREMMKGKRVLLADDIVTTGKTLVGMSQAVSRSGGEVVGACTICDRGKIQTLKYVPNNSEGITGVECSISIIALTELDLMTFDKEECPFCKARRPINPELGQYVKEIIIKQDLQNTHMDS